MPTRQEILEAVRGFAAGPAAPFVPGETYLPAPRAAKAARQAGIPASGKQIGPDEIAACADAGRPCAEGDALQSSR